MYETLGVGEAREEGEGDECHEICTIRKEQQIVDTGEVGAVMHDQRRMLGVKATLAAVTLVGIRLMLRACHGSYQASLHSMSTRYTNWSS